MLLLVAAVLAATPPAQSKGASVQPSHVCRKAESYVAGASGVYRGGSLRPRKLTELPPATAYMAVERFVNGCEAPLTVADYRKSQR